MYTGYNRNSKKKKIKKIKKGEKTALMFLKIIQINQQVNRPVNLLVYKYMITI